MPHLNLVDLVKVKVENKYKQASIIATNEDSLKVYNLK